MRLVCDHHVPMRLVTAFRETPWIDVVTVAETLGPGADDGRPMTARGYKGPHWLIDRLPRFGSSESESDE